MKKEEIELKDLTKDEMTLVQGGWVGWLISGVVALYAASDRIESYFEELGEEIGKTIKGN
ncbi:MAG: hypothetical protein HWE21_05255 [Cytophagia bacterium]|nr:hypothetical protein [Cytophagia bacterium]